MLKKTALILFTLLLTVSLLIGCGETDATDNGGKESQEASNSGKDSSDNGAVDSQTDETNSYAASDETDSDATTDESDSDTTDEDSGSAADAKLNFILTPAEGWTAVESASVSTLCEYENGNGASLKLIEDYLPDGITTAMDLADYELKETKDVFTDAEYTGPDEVTVGGLDGAYVNMAIDMADGSIQYTDWVYFIKDGKAYRFDGVSCSTEEQGTKDIGTMIDTMTIE